MYVTYLQRCGIILPTRDRMMNLLSYMYMYVYSTRYLCIIDRRSRICYLQGHLAIVEEIRVIPARKTQEN